MRTYSHADLTGKTVGRLTVLREVGKAPNARDYVWLCQCSCGAQKEIAGNSLRLGRTKSCGCLAVEKATARCISRTTHGHTCGPVMTPTYRAWATMIQRCTNPNVPKYQRYGARGISVCSRWFDFANFLADMGQKPKGLTLGRINNDGHYEPSNCEWQTPKQQANNKSNNQIIAFRGQVKTMSQWADYAGIRFTTLRMRLHRGWSVERALTQKS